MVRFTGDNRTGAGEGDDETVYINVGALSYDVAKIAIAVTIYNANEQGHSFSQVTESYIRIINHGNGKEMTRFNLAEQLPDAQGVLFGYLTREGTNWIFEPVAEPIDGGLSKIATRYGIIVQGNV